MLTPDYRNESPHRWPGIIVSVKKNQRYGGDADSTRVWLLRRLRFFVIGSNEISHELAGRSVRGLADDLEGGVLLLLTTIPCFEEIRTGSGAAARRVSFLYR